MRAPWQVLDRHKAAVELVIPDASRDAGVTFDNLHVVGVCCHQTVLVDLDIVQPVVLSAADAGEVLCSSAHRLACHHRLHCLVTHRELLHCLVGLETVDRSVRRCTVVLVSIEVYPNEVPGVDLPEVTRVGPVMAVEPLVIIHQRTALGGAGSVGITVVAVVLVHSGEPPLHSLGDAVAATERADDATLAARILLLTTPHPSCDGPLPRAGRPLQRVADVRKARPHVVRVDGGALSGETEVLAVTRCAWPVHQPLRLVGRVVEEVHPYEVGDGARDGLVVVWSDVLGKWHDQPVTRCVRLVAVRSV